MGKKFKDLKIGRKLLISYGAIIFLYIITVTASLLGIAKTSNTLDVFLSEGICSLLYGSGYEGIRSGNR